MQVKAAPPVMLRTARRNPVNTSTRRAQPERRPQPLVALSWCQP